MWLDSKAVNCPQKWGNFRAPFLPAPGSCRGQSSEGPFLDQLSFEFRQSREEREDQLSAGGRRVDAGPLAGEHPDPDVPVVEVLHQVDEMAEIATEAIEPPGRRSRLPAAPP